jgi:Flp pilus assembly protein TadG
MDLEAQLPIRDGRHAVKSVRCLQMRTICLLTDGTKLSTSRTGEVRARRRYGRIDRQSGAELLEMAFALTILLTLVLGIFWFGRAYNIYETMTRAAREGARVAVAPACSACTLGGQMPSIATVASAVQGSLVASNLDPTQVACGTCPGTCYGSAPTICYQNNVVLNPSTTPPENGVIVSFTYPFQLAIPFVTFNQNLTLSTTVRMRQED